MSHQHWRTFVKNHAQGIVACDFLVAVTARFRVLFVFVMMEIGSRLVLHYNLTAHPTAEWTRQQLREAIPSDHCYQFLIHDRDSIFSRDLDEEFKGCFGLRVLRTPVRAPKANAYCERLIGTVRRAASRPQFIFGFRFQCYAKSFDAYRIASFIKAHSRNANPRVIPPRDHPRKEVELSIGATCGSRIEDALDFERITRLRLHYHSQAL